MSEQTISGGALTSEQLEALLAPIDETVGAIQTKIDELRKDGTYKIQELRNKRQLLKEDKHLTKDERQAQIKDVNAQLEKAKAVESKNNAEVERYVKEAESYLAANYDSKYYEPLKSSLKEEEAVASQAYKDRLVELSAEHKGALAATAQLPGDERRKEVRNERYVYKNKKFDAKTALQRAKADIKLRRHDGFTHKYHMIDLLRLGRFTFAQQQAQKLENYSFNFNRKQFMLKNGLFIVVLLIFIALCIIAPIWKNTDLLTGNNLLNIAQQASPRIFLALGVAGLILLTGTDLSIGRMVGMGMVAATVIMHKGPNTGGVFGHVFDFSSVPILVRSFGALIACIVLCVLFTSIAGFFTAKFKMHPFISTMANMLIIFGIVTYATKGVSFGAIESEIPAIFIPRIGSFPTIIVWAIVVIVVMWFIWNKTKFGKHLYAVGGNPEAAAVSGISVFKVTLGAFIMAGVLYGFGSWLEALRMVGSGSAAYGQGWDMDAIAACVVGGVSFTGGIGKISGVVVGVAIFTALTYSLTILGIDTNLQFVFSGIVVLAAVALDSVKYIQKK